MTIYFYESDIGRIGIAEKDGRITNVYFTEDEAPKDIQICETPLLKEAARQLDEERGTMTMSKFYEAKKASDANRQKRKVNPGKGGRKRSRQIETWV